MTKFLALCTVAAAVAFGVVSDQASAAADSYQCTVVEHLELSDNGKMVASPWSASVGQRFAVARGDGRIIGATAFSNASASSVVVLHQGGEASSFKSVSVWRRVLYRTLMVQEFIDDRRKPFLLSDSWGNVYSGHCE